MMQRLGAGIARLPRASPLAGGISSRGSCTKLFVGVKVICDHMSGKSKGYGFVQFESEAAASTALNELDGKSLDGRDIRVHYAQKRNGGL
ncbi:hypothetical protein BT93_J1376 [Corymbia citriodora subsp. variegata]|nr:hypothetical protein BT93_J1376 [Corymbia citriodora subsp. variegata]KAF8010705.1 hypothetical protein BT93_J1376 [Corymbia citriodora subsp. variegata]KAF8010706.1 hypothetical protein BT93_J1376 [Corymbia citriodora subsp. variegata]